MSVVSKPASMSNDVLRLERRPLDNIFNPRSVALIGATENPGSVGRTLLRNLIDTPFGGTIFPVNPKRDSVLGIKAYKSVADVPAKVDLAVIATQASIIPGVVKQCVDAGIPAAIIISAGFKEMGAPGVELERQILVEARRGRMRIIGPNCLGVMNPLTGLNATFAKGIARPGNVAFLSQSGALCTAILDWSFRESVGFSSFVSVGSMLDVGWGDLIDYLGNDPRTQSILMYMETIGDARAFLSAAREVALNKPIIVIKPGRTEAAAKAAASHTGSLAGSDDVLEAAFRRVGVLRVSTIADLFYMAETLAKQPRPRGPRLTIVTNAGGPGVLATDALIGNGGELTKISEQTFTELNGFLPAHWSRNNPIDILGDAGADRYAKALEVAARDPNADGMLVVLTPQDMTNPTQTADALKQYAKIEGKPVIASWMGGPDIQAGEDILNKAGIPTFPYPDTAARVFSYMHRYATNLGSIYETPALDEADTHDSDAAARARRLIDGALAEGRTLLTEHESKQLLLAYNIPTSETIPCTNSDQAVAAARKIGYPVVVKLESKSITHKTDVGGVKLNLIDDAAVKYAFDEIKRTVTQHAGAAAFDGVTVQKMVKLKDAYELIVGASLDSQFGPVLLFGAGGVLVEVFKDKALGLPPLNATLARRMIEQTKIAHALHGTRGRKPVDMKLLEMVLVRFSRLVVEQPRIKELDINPLLAGPDGIVALDGRVVLHEPTIKDADLPASAIRPYPSQYVQNWTLKDGTPVVIRPIRPEDEPLMVKFHETLSERSVRLRYFQTMLLPQRVAHARLTRVCFNDYDRELALVVERKTATGREILGVGRLSKVPGLDEGEFALTVADIWQHKGIGTKLLSLLIEVSKHEKLTELGADILPENTDMQAVCRKLGFTIKHDVEDQIVHASIAL
jgi:acetyltransferase